jgi:phage-related protein
MTILKTTLVAVAEVLSLLFKNIITIFSTVGDVFGSIIDTIKGIGAAIVAVVNRDWDALNNAVDDTGVGILNVTQSIVSGFEELGDNFSTFGKNMADNLINSYQAVFGDGMQKVEEDLGEAGDEAGKAFVEGFTMRLQEMGSVGVISALAPAAITAKDSMMGLKNALSLVNVEMLTLEQMGERIGKVIMDLSEPIKMFGSQAIGGLADAFGSAISGGENFGASILSIFGGFMKQLGQLMIGTAISAQKFMATLLVPGPAALAAGIALVALGSAFTKKASNMTQSMGSGGGGGSASTSMGGRGMSTDVTRLAGPPVNIEGEFQIRGRDLVMVLEKTNYSNTKTRG